MKLNYKRTILVGFAFFLISAFWQAYDNSIPMILTNKFGMSQTGSGVISAIDNILAVVLLPIFGDLPGLAARIYGKDQDQVFATVRDNLTCYADVSALPVQARNHLAQELLVGYHEGCRKA